MLIKQLQEQHYRQYMQQVYQQQMESQASQAILATKTDEQIAQQLDAVVHLGEEDPPEPLEGEDHDGDGQSKDVDHECSDECGYCCDEDNGKSWMKMRFKADINGHKKMFENICSCASLHVDQKRA